MAKKGILVIIMDDQLVRDDIGSSYFSRDPVTLKGRTQGQKVKVKVKFEKCSKCLEKLLGSV